MLSFCEPMLQVLKSGIETCNGLTEENEKMLCESLELIGICIQYLDVPISTNPVDGSIQRHVSSLLLDHLLPLLRQLFLCPTLAMNEKVTSAGFK